MKRKKIVDQNNMESFIGSYSSSKEVMASNTVY